jgi:hypothetical protein
LLAPVSGHVRRVVRRRGVVWYVKYRMPDPTRPGRVRQVEKMLGPEWPDTGPPPPGYYDRRSARAALEAILTDARRGAIALARTGVTFEQAAIEWLRWGEHQRGWKRSTLVDRRSALKHHLRPEFGALAVNQITARRVEAWKIRGWPSTMPAARARSCGPSCTDQGAGAQALGARPCRGSRGTPVVAIVVAEPADHRQPDAVAVERDGIIEAVVCRPMRTSMGVPVPRDRQSLRVPGLHAAPARDAPVADVDERVLDDLPAGRIRARELQSPAIAGREAVGDVGDDAAGDGAAEHGDDIGAPV